MVASEAVLTMSAENSTEEFNVTNQTFYFEAQEHEFYNTHLHNVTLEKWIIYGIAMPSLVGLSLVFNGLIFVVLLRAKFKSSLYLLLHCLACYDILVAILSFWAFSLPSILLYFNWFDNYTTEIHPLVVPFLMPIWHMAITGSDYLNLAAACERCLVSHFHTTSRRMTSL